MFKKKYSSLFPNTVNAKNVIAPYNRKALRRSKRATKVLSESSFTKRQTSQLSIQLKDLNDFSLNNHDLHMLLLDAGDTLKESTGADGVSVYMVDQDTMKIFLLTGDEADIGLEHYRFPIEKGTTVAAHVACIKEAMVIENIYIDPRFSEGIGFNYYNARSVLCVPVVSQDGDCYSIFELVKEDDEAPFNKEDSKVVTVLAGWMSFAIYQNLTWVTMLKNENFRDYLSKVTGSYFKEETDTTKMVTDFMNFTKKTIGVPTGTFFLIDKQYQELTAEVYEEGIDNVNVQYVRKNLTAKLLQKDRGIVTLVAKACKTCNVKNALRDRRIGNEHELRVGKTLKTLLCMPILTSSNELVGIFKLLNKKSGFFNKGDECTIKYFSMYVACCLQYNIKNRQLQKAELNYRIFNSHLKRMMRPCSHEYEYALKNTNLKLPNILDFKWYISEPYQNETPQIAVFMVKDLCDDGSLNHDNLIKFMLTARRLYRNVPYHNFDHGFTFMHCMYNILKRNKTYFTTFEMKALLISSIVHDIDHGGHTNTFLGVFDDVIYQLYQKSSWENYHFLVAEMLFERFPIFTTTPTTYKEFMKEIKYNILATDLSGYWDVAKSIVPLINANNFDIQNSDHRYLLKSVMMTVSDFSAQYKPFSIVRGEVAKVYKEFYDEGDKLKAIKYTPFEEQMDRELQYKQPEQQIKFLKNLVSPAAIILEDILSDINLYEHCRSIQDDWRKVELEAGRKIKKIMLN